MSLVISGFPGIGKTHFFNNEKLLTVSDSDSIKFDKSDFPRNYIEHIKSLIDKRVDVILVSSHAEVRKALDENGIYYTMALPERMYDKWDEFHDGMKETEFGTIFRLKYGGYLDKDVVQLCWDLYMIKRYGV